MTVEDLDKLAYLYSFSLALSLLYQLEDKHPSFTNEQIVRLMHNVFDEALKATGSLVAKYEINAKTGGN